MQDFVYYTPTEVVFGKESESQIAALVKKHGGSKVLVHYGGQSAIRSGLLDKVESQLKEAGIEYICLGGVVPNPRLSLVKEGIALCQREAVDFILAVGGGSVIDSSKAIAYGLCYDGDVWDFFCGKAVAKAAMPIGVVLTIPAAGSEMSDSCVITNEDGDIKRGYSSNVIRCKFAVMNPERTYTLPAYQTACGAVDIMMHTMERYFSPDTDMPLTDALAEGLLKVVKDSAYRLLADPQDYNARAQIMWASSLAHNDLTGCGMRSDFATHKLEHELSALFDVAHGAGLAAVWGSWARYVMDANISRFEQFAVNVMGVNPSEDSRATALAGIEAMEAFYRDIDMPVSIKELLGREVSDEEISLMADKCSRDGSLIIGSFKKLDRQDMVNIYLAAK